MGEDENEALANTLKDAARKWGNQTYTKLDSATQNLVRRGLDMRLDKIDVAYKEELVKLLDERAEQKWKELVEESATSTAATTLMAAGTPK